MNVENTLDRRRIRCERELQHALAQESSVCHDQLQQTLRQHTCQEEYADAATHQVMEQLKQLIPVNRAFLFLSSVLIFKFGSFFFVRFLFWSEYK